MDAVERARAHQSRYFRFKHGTGKTYKNLQDIHQEALIQITRNKEKGSFSGHMAVSPALVEYLTALALEHLAVGATLAEGPPSEH